MKNKMFYFIEILLGIRIILSISTISSNIKIISDIATVLLVVLCCIKLLYSKYNTKSILIMYGMIIFSLYTCYVTGQLTVFITILILISLKDVDLKQAIKTIHNTKIILLIIHIFVYFFSLVVLKKEINLYVDNNMGYRHSFFLGHPNSAAAIFLGLVFESIYLNYDKINVKKICYLGIFIVFGYVFTKSRTMLYISLFSLFMLYMFKNNIFNIFKKKNALIAFGIMILFISYVPMFCFSNENLYIHSFLERFDGFLSWRLRYGNIGYEKFGIHLLPFQIDFENIIVEVIPFVYTKLIIDNIYIKMAIHYGIIWLLIFMFTIFKILKRVEPVDMMMIYIMFFYGFSESYIVNIGVVPFLFIIGYYILNKEKNKKID